MFFIGAYKKFWKVLIKSQQCFIHGNWEWDWQSRELGLFLNCTLKIKRILVLFVELKLGKY